MSTETELVSLFECPRCYNYILPPIMQCRSGHLLCSDCWHKIFRCPLCKSLLSYVRNHAMETVASMLQFPCKYSKKGCTATFVYTTKAEHEQDCEYKPYSCPCLGTSCKWQGALEEVVPHLKKSHNSVTTIIEGEDIVFQAGDVNLHNSKDWLLVQSCFDQHFMLVLKKEDKFNGHHQLFAVVKLIGSRNEAKNFAYRLKLNGQHCTLTWEAKPRSCQEGAFSAVMNSDCLVFGTSIAELFANNRNHSINITMSIFKSPHIPK